MTLSLIAAAVVGLAIGQAGAPAPAAQAQPAPTEQATPQPAEKPSEVLGSRDPDDKLICRKVRTVGSNMVSRDCRTAAQRRKEASDARDALNGGGRSLNNIDLGGAQ